MKKAIVIILAGFILAGCGRNDHIVRHKERRLQCVETYEDCYIVVDMETGIGYLKTTDGGLTVMYDSNGEIYRPNGWRDYD